MTDFVTFERVDDTAVLTLDDGKANAFGFAMFDALNAGLDRALGEARAVAVLGRPGILSGGFDLKVLNGGDETEIRRLVDTGVRTLMRLYGHPQPLVAAATGHAVALGAFVLLASDHRVGIAGEFRIGLNETAIGLTLPRFGVELARERLSPRHVTAAAIGARMYDPQTAIEAGFLDEVVAAEAVRDTAFARANAMAGLDAAAFAATKQNFRKDTIEAVLADRG